jgi:hypothetical protein
VQLYQSILLAEKTLQLSVIRGLHKGLSTVLTGFLFWVGGALFFANLQRRQLWYCRMDYGDDAVNSIVVATVAAHLQQHW